jgi:hypothetical protein
MSMKNSSDTIGNRTRGLPACSAVHQPTTPPRAPVVLLRTNGASKAITMRQTLLSFLEIWQRTKKFSVTWCYGLVTMKTVNSANGSVTSPPHNPCNQVVRSNSPATMAIHAVAKMVWRPMETGNHDNKVWLAPNIIFISEYRRLIINNEVWWVLSRRCITNRTESIFHARRLPYIFL